MLALVAQGDQCCKSKKHNKWEFRKREFATEKSEREEKEEIGKSETRERERKRGRENR